MNLRIAISTTLATFALIGGASAATLYDNPYAGYIDELASCSFNTKCSLLFNGVTAKGAQAFTLSSAAVVKSASFTELDLGALPTAINWYFYDDDGEFGAPGSLLVSGQSNVADYVTLGSAGPYQRNQIFFDLPQVALTAGSYLFALQIVAPNLSNFLVEGKAYNGAWEQYGSEPWTPRYGGSSAALSVAVGLYDTSRPGIPEPSTWALMIMGFGLVGGALRRGAAWPFRKAA